MLPRGGQVWNKCLLGDQDPWEGIRPVEVKTWTRAVFPGERKVRWEMRS